MFFPFLEICKYCQCACSRKSYEVAAVVNGELKAVRADASWLKQRRDDNLLPLPDKTGNDDFPERRSNTKMPCAITACRRKCAGKRLGIVSVHS